MTSRPGSSGPLTPARDPLDTEREHIVRQLSDAFAQDHLQLEQLESRLAQVWRATSTAELERLIADLPAPSASSVPAEATAPPPTVGSSKTLLAVMGGVFRRGIWGVPSEVSAIAIMGGVQLDLREARLSARVTEITAVAIMGAVEIIVPPDVRLESDGVALMGGFEDQLHEPATGTQTVIRVRGFALMGGVETKVVERGVKLED